ncbi:Uncharacterised protein [Salmonella enterica subsp. arizonae]|uniref:Uncharacterized protein n=1 Tax=Salmonella enterica subsp. arizonae TaxID=59203 RepID=A0A379XJP3_SALER|nr:Uncharacterised protein [Salmonella enterica subsp. arizonae]
MQTTIRKPVRNKQVNIRLLMRSVLPMKSMMLFG